MTRIDFIKKYKYYIDKPENIGGYKLKPLAWEFLDGFFSRCVKKQVDVIIYYIKFKNDRFEIHTSLPYNIEDELKEGVKKIMKPAKIKYTIWEKVKNFFKIL